MQPEVLDRSKENWSFLPTGSWLVACAFQVCVALRHASCPFDRTRVSTHDYFSETETHRIVGVLDTENHASRKLCESLDFRREAEHRKSYWDKKMNEWSDEYVYAMLKEDWVICK